MPHVILECSANILEKATLSALLRECNQVISPLLSTPIESCKSRAFLHSVFCVGDQMKNAAFAHLDIKILPGRTTEVIERLGQRLLQVMQIFFSRSLAAYDLQLTINISELEKTYIKYRASKA